MGILFVSVICIIVIIFLFHFYHYRLRLSQTRTLDIEERLYEHRTTQLFTQVQAQIVMQRQTRTNNTMEGEEPSSAVMTVAYTVKDEAGS